MAIHVMTGERRVNENFGDERSLRDCVCGCVGVQRVLFVLCG